MCTRDSAVHCVKVKLDQFFSPRDNFESVCIVPSASFTNFLAIGENPIIQYTLFEW